MLSIMISRYRKRSPYYHLWIGTWSSSRESLEVPFLLALPCFSLFHWQWSGSTRDSKWDHFIVSETERNRGAPKGTANLAASCTVYPCCNKISSVFLLFQPVPVHLGKNITLWRGLVMFSSRLKALDYVNVYRCIKKPSLPLHLLWLRDAVPHRPVSFDQRRRRARRAYYHSNTIGRRRWVIVR